MSGSVSMRTSQARSGMAAFRIPIGPVSPETPI